MWLVAKNHGKEEEPKEESYERIRSLSTWLPFAEANCAL